MLATLSRVVVSIMLESPTITCMRRNRAESAWGSSRVLMRGRERVVAEETPSHMCSARWEKQKVGPSVASTPTPAGVPGRILPAPQITCPVSYTHLTLPTNREG